MGARLFHKDAPFDFAVARRLYEDGLFFECHEYLEEEWRRAEGPRKRCLQGLIQAAAGLHKLRLGSASGCAELLENGAAKLEACGAPSARLAAELRDAARRARAGTLVLADAPPLPADLVL